MQTSLGLEQPGTSTPYSRSAIRFAVKVGLSIADLNKRLVMRIRSLIRKQLSSLMVLSFHLSGSRVKKRHGGTRVT